MVRFRVLAAALAAAGMLAANLTTVPAAASASEPNPPTIGGSVRNDTSPPLRTLHASPVAETAKGNHAHQPLPATRTGARVPTATRSIQTSVGGTAIPSTSANFEGINNLDGVLPPDTNGDIGPNHYVQWVNLHFEIFSRIGTPILGPTPGNTLWSGLAGLCGVTNQGDPVVRYDRMADRWVFTQFAFNVTRRGVPVAPYEQCVAVSTSGDPTGSYYRYDIPMGSFPAGNSYFPDYPKLAIWPDAYYLSFNYFSGTTFVGGEVLALDRASMLRGTVATVVGFGPLGAAYGGLLASDLDGSILPPAGSPNYFAAVDTSVAPSGSTLQIWKFHVDWTTPGNSTFGTASGTPNFTLAVDPYAWLLCNGSANCLSQPGTSAGLDPLADRLMNRLQYRRFPDGHESLVANHTVSVNGNQAGIRWYEIRNLSTAPTVYQQGTYAPSPDSRWMGSIAMDQSGDIVLGYSVSSTAVFPSIRYTGRTAADPLGTLPQGEASVIAGSGSQTSSFDRWGDYSMMAVDPTDDCTFWYTQEYYATTSDRGWLTRVASFKFPSCGQPWSAGYGVANTPTNWAATQTQSYAVTVTNTGNQTWPASGTNPVHLGVHFANAAAGTGTTWYTDQRFTLPADVPPAGSATLTTTVTGPNLSGNLVIEYQMVKEQQFWFGQFADVNATVAAAVWSGSYSVANTPTNWAVNQAQAYTVTITNTGNQTWSMSGANPVHLGVHFANAAGGTGTTWYTDQRFTLPADLSPGARVDLTISVTAPNVNGNLVIEYQMVKEQQFWFGQFASVNATVVAAVWSASYNVLNAPANWAANQTQSYTVAVTNTGNQTWPASGANPVHLGVHFANTAGGTGTTWYTDQRFTLPADVPPSASVTLTTTVTAPNLSGNLVVEYQMVKEQQFWFGQFADVNASVAAAVWSASYIVANTPTSWAANQTQTYTVTVTNTSNQTWPASGTNPVHLGVHFANAAGGTGTTWYTDQRFVLPADLSPGAKVDLSISVTAPNVSGNLVIEYQMVKEQQFWFAQFADVNATVK